MKKIFLLLSFLLANQVFAQVASTNMKAIKDDLENGIFIRTMNLQFINSIDTAMLRKNYKKKIQLKPRDVETYNFLRFSAFEYDTTHDVYVGKVFLSNRYLFWEFRKKYPNHDSMLVDKNGYFMTCKLYQLKKEIKLNIYPELLTNIYKKNFCTVKEKKALGIDTLKITNKNEYFEALKRVALIKDANATDFIAQPQSADKMLESRALNNEMELRINFKKQIKIFEVVKNQQNKVVALDLQYNKYAFSDDLVETKYRYDFRRNMTNMTAKIDTVVWILAGELPKGKKSTTAIAEDISNLIIGNTIFVKGNVEIFNVIAPKNTIQPRRTQNADKWEIIAIQELDLNKKKQIWIKIKGGL
jgi:hypothetical protein